MSHESLIRTSTVMAIGTIFSRVTGLIRGLLLVAVLGTTLLGDTYNVANTMPNILYNLIIGGALTAVFVPQLVRAVRLPDGGSAFISRLITATCVVLGAVVVVSVIVAPLLVRVFASSYEGRPEFHLTVLFMRYCLPQIFFMGLFALLGQVANAKGKFGAMMWAPVLNNLIVISVFSYYLHISNGWSVSTITNSQATWMGIGTTAGFVVQVLFLIPVIKGTKIRIQPRFDWKDPEIKTSLKLASWTLMFAAISQLSYLITVNFSTGAAVRAIKDGITTGVGYTPYGNAFLILMLPHSIVTISIVTALLPMLSAQAIDKKYEEIHNELVKAIRLVGIITVPSGIAFFLFGPLITRSLFFGISNPDARYLGLVLAGFSFGLMPLSVNLIALRGLNAFENVKLQVLSNVVMNMVSIIGSLACVLALPAKWVTVGLAGALSVSYYIGAWTTIRLLRRYSIAIHIGEICGFYGRLGAIYMIVGLPLYLLMGQIPGGNAVRLLFVLVISLLGYLGIARLFNITEVGTAFRIFLKPKG
jgi:putative peptidoglycan lipid II flippase